MAHETSQEDGSHGNVQQFGEEVQGATVLSGRLVSSNKCICKTCVSLHLRVVTNVGRMLVSEYHIPEDVQKD